MTYSAHLISLDAKWKGYTWDSLVRIHDLNSKINNVLTYDPDPWATIADENHCETPIMA